MDFLRGGTRIYAAPGRVVAQFDADDPNLAPRTAEQTNRNDNYLTALLKLVPAEIVSVYMAICDSATQHHAITLWFFTCLGACFLLRAYASQPKTAPPGFRNFVKNIQWVGVIVSCIAFLLWAVSIGAQSPVPFLPLEQWLASALAALLSAFAPIFVPGDRSSPGA